MDPFDNDILHNKNIEEDSEIGIHPCTLTGNFLEDSQQFVEVVMEKGVTRYARLAFSFPLFSGVTAAWLAKYSNSLYGYVAFEKGKPESAVLIAVSLKEGASIDLKGFPDSVVLLSQLFQLDMNDKTRKLTVDFKQPASFRLGSESASQPMVKGNELVSVLADLATQISLLANQCALITVVPASLAVPTPPPVNAAAIAQVSANVAAMQATLQKILSQKSYLE